MSLRDRLRRIRHGLRIGKEKDAAPAANVAKEEVLGPKPTVDPFDRGGIDGETKPWYLYGDEEEWATTNPGKPDD